MRRAARSASNAARRLHVGPAAGRTFARLWAGLVLAGWLAFSVTGALAATEAGLFNSALKAFKDGFYDQSEKDFAAFISEHTNSARLAEAVLLQAQSRLKQNNAAGAIQLLEASESRAGSIGDQYLFWIAAAFSQQGNLRAAATNYARLAANYPDSPLRLEAVINEATIHGNLGEWARAVTTLNGSGVLRGGAGATNALVATGYQLLAEAQFATGDFPGAEASLGPLAPVKLNPEPAWRRQHLLCRILSGTGRNAEALQGATNLVAIAGQSGSRTLQAQSAAFLAGLLERAGNVDDALALYGQNVAEGVPPELQRQALLRSSELLISRGRIGEAAQLLERFTTNAPAAPGVDAGLAALGELRLRQYAEASPTNMARTNFLLQAQASLARAATNASSPVLSGKASLNLGWSHWLENKYAEAEAGFEKAAATLPLSEDQALAVYKLADAQLRQGKRAAAASNYLAVVDRFAALPSVSTNLFEPALYQAVRAGLDAGNLALSSEALSRLLADFPDSYNTEKAVLLTGQTVSRLGDPAAAREIFGEFVKKNPGATLKAEASLAVARTYESQGKWAEAGAQYDAWLKEFTNNPARARAEFQRAQAWLRSGQQTQGMSSLTNLLERFPTNEISPLARWWVADYYFGAGNLQAAEYNYQLLFQNPAWAKTQLGYQARMMAGRVSAARRVWKDSSQYFLDLYNDTNAPQDLRMQALFAYGDNLISRDSTNKLADYEEAIRVFGRVQEAGPTNRLGLLALGQKAVCLLQWVQSDSGTNALQAFRELATSPYADITARSIASVGMGVALERQTTGKTPAEQAALMQQALGHYLDVLYFEKNLKPGEQPDLFWVRKAGEDAARLAETAGNWQQAINVYRRLQELYPAKRGAYEKSIAKVSESLARAR